jgi:hypothetical protein
MRNQTINLNLIPGGVMPVVHLSQYDQDVDGSLIFNIYNGMIPYDLTGGVAHIQGHKPDDTIFDYECTVHDTYVTAATEYQMTVMAGQYPAELRISKDGSAVGTLNFIFAVEPSTATGADLSHTDIPDLMLEIEQAVVASAAHAESAETSEENAEAWAVGQRNGTDVPDTDPTYHNNSKYYAGQASTSASNAYTSETNAGTSESNAAASERNAEGSAEDSEAWAVGERDGVPVSSDDPTYHNNAKYWSQQSQTVADMTGATAQDAGAHGLVPAPAAGDNSKFLRGDGTWQSVSDVSDSTVTFTDASQDGAITSGSPLKTLISLIKFKLTNRSAASGGSDVSLVTTGEKYTWDNKAENSEFTGVTSGPTPGHHGLVPAPTAGYPDKYLRSNGSWSDLPTPDYVDEQFNPATTYSKGMTCISGNKRYEYINSTASSGHQPPDATYWKVLSVTNQLNEGTAFVKAYAASQPWLTTGFRADYVTVVSGGYYIKDNVLFIRARVKSKVAVAAGSSLVVMYMQSSVVPDASYPLITYRNPSYPTNSAIYTNGDGYIAVAIFNKEAVAIDDMFDIIGFANLV